MFAIIGLGNPGAKYENTRHNIGFRVVDSVAERAKLSGWKEKSRCSYLKGEIFSRPALLIKPQNYMNLSGECAAPLLKFFQVSMENVIVIYDDLDLSPGVIRVKRGGGSGGHNGVENCITHFTSPDFIRIRVGIGRPDKGEGTNIFTGNISDWVLSTAGPEEKELLMDAVQKSVDAVEMLLQEGLLPVQNRFNRT